MGRDAQGSKQETKKLTGIWTLGFYHSIHKFRSIHMPHLNDWYNFQLHKEAVDISPLSYLQTFTHPLKSHCKGSRHFQNNITKKKECSRKQGFTNNYVQHLCMNRISICTRWDLQDTITPIQQESSICGFAVAIKNKISTFRSASVAQWIRTARMSMQ